MSWVITGSEKTPVDQLGIQNVSLLLHGDGANGSTTITDNSPSPKTVTAVGNAQISTAQSKFGGASIAFDGSGDYLLSTANAAFDFDSNNFTIETWFYIAGNSTADSQGSRNCALVSRYPSIGTITGWAFGILGNASTTGTGLFFSRYISGTAVDIVATTSVSQSTWHHFAVCRDGSTVRLFFNGSEVRSSAISSTVNATHDLNIGRSQFTGFLHQLNGYIDDLRITKGIARYTANFTPPTAPFPDI
jgi:hypothetical protein